MAYKFILVLLLGVVYVNCENNELCACDSEPKDDEALWKFLEKLSIDKKDKDNLNYVLAGQLSPLVDCSCESTRKKRKAVEEPEAPVKELETPVEVENENEGVRARKSIRFGDKRCPQGFARLGFTCVDEDYLE